MISVDRVKAIPASEVWAYWGELEPLLAQAMKFADGKLTVTDLYWSIQRGEFQLWLIPGGVWVTRIVSYPQSKRLEMIAGAGEWQDWLTHGGVVAEWARREGCDAVELIGRPGWGRKTGFEEIHRTFRVRI
jgi:hypothetical protein